MKNLTTLTGPSCAGKSTLEKMMVERGAMKAVSITTRSPRVGEIDGVDYYFISKAKFATMQECGCFVECVQFGEHAYGLSTAELNRLYALGSHVVVVCEPIGAAMIQRYCKEDPTITLTSVFVDNPSSVIADRFLKRAIDDAAGAKTSEDRKKFFDGYAKRLAMMINVEPNWRTAAYNASSALPHYDMVFETFNETNAERIANLICLAPVSTA